MIRFIVICFVLPLVTVRVEGYCNVKGYYWRDFSGEIPNDALPGGIDINGDPIYIGQIYDSRFLLSAKIYMGNPNAFYELEGKQFSTKKNIKILCTQHPEHFEWIKTNNDDIKLLIDKHFIIGGFRTYIRNTYIGRVRSGGELSVGKLLVSGSQENAGLYVTKNGQATKHTSFEVLTYNPYASPTQRPML